MALGGLIFRVFRIVIALCISRTQLKYTSLADVSTQHFYKSVPICLGLNIYSISFFLLIFHSLTHFFSSHCIPFFTFPLYFNTPVSAILSISGPLTGEEWRWLLPAHLRVHLGLFWLSNKVYIELFLHWPAISNYFWIYSIWCVLHVSDTCFLVLMVTPKNRFTQLQELHSFSDQ